MIFIRDEKRNVSEMRELVLKLEFISDRRVIKI